MTVRELILILEKHDPEMPVVSLKSDLDFGTCMDIEGVVEQLGKRYPDSKDWNIEPKSGESGFIKVLLVE